MIELSNITGFEIPTNPFPGLRPFEFKERLLYFGRDGQSEQLIRKLNAIRFVVVVGTSGSGKSSLVRAGLLPALYSGFMASAGSDWRIAVMRPGNDPLGNLARALNADNVFGSGEEEEAQIQSAITETALRRGSTGLVEVVRQARIESHESVLVVVDQFEEIFRFARVAESEQYQNDAAAFVKLLLEGARQREFPIYVLLTMRSDFLGDCSLFWDLPEAINSGQYLIPRLTREQRREAITGPIAICGAEATPRLLTRLLNDMGNNPDQLPILQHALMRTWNKWKQEAHENEPLDLSHYEAIGTMAHALSLHADEAYDELPDERSKKIAERIFKALTEKGADNRETRRPTLLNDLCALTEAEESEVTRVIETFRSEGRSFLMPPTEVPLHANSLIDISHESLIRNWNRLKQWVEEDARSARTYCRLADTARLYSKGEAGLWRDPDLQLAIQWREQSRPNPAWAERYDPDFESAINFLDESRKARDKEIEEKETHRKNQIKRNRLFIIVLATAFVVSCALAIYAWHKRQIVEVERKRVQKELYLSDIRTAYESFAMNSIPRTLELLDAHTDDELRGFDWYHLWWLLQGDIKTLKGHTQLVRSVAFSPDGRMIASSSGDNTIKLWDVASHSEMTTLRGHAKLIRSIAFSPDGKSIASGSSDSTIKLWDVASPNSEPVTLKGHKGEIYSVAFSPDGKTVASAGGLDKVIKLWDVASQSELSELGELNKQGKRESHANAVYSVAFSPDGKSIASGSFDNTIKLWDVASRTEITTLRGHTNGVNSVAFSPDGRMLASGSNDSTIKLWDLVSHKELAELRERNNRIRSVAFSPDGRMLASGSDDSTVKLWDVTQDNELAKPWDRSSNVPSVAPSPDEKALANGSTGNLDKIKKLWDVNSRRRLTTFKGHRDMVYSVAFSPDGKTVASGSDDSTIKLWDATSPNKLYAPFKRHTENPKEFPSVAVAVSPDGKTVASSDSADVEIKLSEVASPNSVPATMKGQGSRNFVYSIAFSPDGKTLASAHGTNTINLWEVASPNNAPVTLKYRGFEEDKTWFLSVAFSPDGKSIASGSSDGVVRLWDVTLPDSEPVTLNGDDKGKDKGVRTVAFSPDGKRVASGSDDSIIKLWDVASHKELAALKGHSSRVTSVAFSSDGKTLASGSFDNTIKLWDVASHEELATLKGHTGSVSSVAFSPDKGELLASGCIDGSIKMWDVASRKEMGTLKELGTLKEQKINRVTSVAFSPDGRTLASGHNDGYVMLRYSSTNEEVANQRK